MSRYTEDQWYTVDSTLIPIEGDTVRVVLEVADLHDLRTGQLYRGGSMSVRAYYMSTGASHTRRKKFRGDYRDHARTMYGELRHSIKRGAGESSIY